MPEIRITMNPIFFNHLKEIVETASRSLRRRPAVNLGTLDQDDEDLLEAWKSGLLLSLREDMEVLTTMLVDLAAGTDILELKDEQAEKLLRAASALRLRLHQSCLKGFPEEALETGMLDFRTLSPDEQRVYGVYLFLANLQEQLVDELDSAAGSWDE